MGSLASIVSRLIEILLRAVGIAIGEPRELTLNDPQRRSVDAGGEEPAGFPSSYTVEEDTEKLPGFPYQKRKTLLSPAERSFYGVLKTVAETSDWDVFAKVRLEDIIDVKRGTEKYQAYRNRIKSRHVDFLVCDRLTVSPLVAVELNDFSHVRNDRQERDAFVSSALEAARLPLLVISARRAYAPTELLTLISEKMEGVGVPSSGMSTNAVMAAASSDHEIPACPRCGGSLVERRSRNDGKRFLGCASYPACRHTEPLASITPAGGDPQTFRTV